MVVPDGMPLVWLGRILGYRSIGRVYGPDLMQAMFSNKEYRDLRHFFYGSNASVITALVNVLVSRFGQFNFVGSYSPPMRPVGFREDDDILLPIREAAPHILWVGLSTPKQELWLQMHMKQIGSGVRDRSGCCIRLGFGNRHASAAVDPTFRIRMAVSPDHGAEASIQAVFLCGSQFCLAFFTEAAEGSSAGGSIS